MSKDEPLLSVRDLSVSFPSERGRICVVGDVCFDVGVGRTVVLVGESGCGKTVTALSILRLITAPGRIEKGRILFRGRDLLELSEKQMRGVRGGDIAMIFQEPATSLNPVYTVGRQIVEALEAHQEVRGERAWGRAVQMLREVEITDAIRCMQQYPHELSGGMQQRVMIAMALSCRPAILIADEPTTALDVTTQGRILELLCELQRQNGMSILFITHDLSVASQIADDVVVMYASKVVEAGPAERVFASPLHPYTQGLLHLMQRRKDKNGYLEVIKGSVPNSSNYPDGCRFHPRCLTGSLDRQCQEKEPQLKEVMQDRFSACRHTEGYTGTIIK